MVRLKRWLKVSEQVLLVGDLATAFNPSSEDLMSLVYMCPPPPTIHTVKK